MAKKKSKFDAKQIKQLLRERIELVALGVCGLLMVLFVIMGLGQAFSASSPAKKIADGAKSLAAKIESAAPAADEPAPAPKDGEEPKDGEGPKDGAPAKEPPRPKLDKDEHLWPTVKNPERFVGGNWYDTLGAGDTKRRNPLVLALLEDDEKTDNIQIQAINAAVKTYRVDPRSGKIDVVNWPGANFAQSFPPMAVDVRPERMVVVHMLFPYKEQLELHRKALRVEKVEQLLQYGMQPQFAGLNVYRGEKGPNDKEFRWSPVYLADKDGKVTAIHAAKDARGNDIKVGDRNVSLLRDTVYDEDLVNRYYHIMPMNGATPLPENAYGRYPQVVLEGVKARGGEADPEPVTPGPKTKKRPDAKGKGKDAGKGGRNPSGGGGIVLPGGPKSKDGEQPQGKDAPQLTIASVSIKPLPKAFQERLKGNINYFHPYGVFPDEKEDKSKWPGDGMDKAPGGFFPKGMFPGKGGRPGTVPMGTEGMPPDETGQTDTESAFGTTPEGRVLVRFVDAEVKPGYTYQYAVQVRLQNPNYKRPADVAYQALAEQKELLSPKWTVTPEVTVAKDFYFYVHDQQPIFGNTKARGFDTSVYGPWLPSEKIPVQIHRWVNDAGHLPVADWSVGERFLIARGEPIGRAGVEVEIPVWDKLLASFKMGYSAGKGKNLLPVDFTSEEAPVVVDFAGGKGHYNLDTLDPRTGAPRRGTVEYEDSAIELLVMSPDGKLQLRNSREDADPETPTGHERLVRYEHWKARVEALRVRPQGNTPNFPMGTGPGANTGTSN